VGGDVQGVTTQGLEYPLQDETLYLGATRGLSNVFLGETALVKLKEGILLCVVIRKEDGG
jgi:thiamine pyrophosphokinase